MHAVLGSRCTLGLFLIAHQQRRAEAGGCRLFLVRAACHGSRFPRKGRDAFPASFGLDRPRSERHRRSSPETTGRLRLPAGKPTATPSPLPISPYVPRLGSPVVSIEQFRRMRHCFLSKKKVSPGLFWTFFLVMSALLSKLMSRIDSPVRQQLDLSGNLCPDGGCKLLAPLHLLD